MADTGDTAERAEALFRRLALARTTGNTTSGPGSTHCDECGEEIPAARREKVAGCRYCVDCQGEIERKGR